VALLVLNTDMREPTTLNLAAAPRMVGDTGCARA
jgi:hypothetical protein